MTNPFSAHGIDHLSPSSLNLWAASPAIFVLERLLKKRSAVGPAAHRGTAVEAGIVHGLMTGLDANESAAKASAEFARLTALMTGDKVDKEARAVPEMTRMGYAELIPYGKPTATQGRVERRVDGLSVPIMGFFDLCWEQHGILLDIKTTHALPSKVSTSHARQVALYNAGLGGGKDVRITYVTPKKVATYSVENIEDHLLALERIAKALQRFLAISADPQELAGLIAPDVDSFYAAEPSTRQSIFEVWGI
jgi:hypothetical protein